MMKKRTVFRLKEKRVGFIGLGTMGHPMARNLLEAGYPLTVYNRTASKADDLVQAGAKRAATPAEAAQAADVLFTNVSQDADLLEVLFGGSGILEGVHNGLTVIDCSTVAPKTSRLAAKELAVRGARFLDAPVTGSKPAAESGSLVFMVGGLKAVMEEHRDLFEVLGSKLLHMGENGSGSYAKLAHNLIVGINSAALAEGMAFAAKAGLDLNHFLEIVQAGGAASKQADLKGRKIIEGNFDVQFSLQLMLKDLLLAMRETATFQLPSPMLNNAASLYQMGLAKGNGPLDLSSVVQCYEDWTGEPVGKGTTSSEDAYSGRDRRKAERVNLEIALQISIYQWQLEGAFSGQTIEATLQDLSGDGLQVVTEYPLAQDMFVVVHFPQEAELPPITARIIRVEKDEASGQFRYGCMMSGLAPVLRVRLVEYIDGILHGR
ncbi:NAD(P)-binding domain-containing protein [Gorillibacterium sp. CAU 1737]|uniref:NAD(P)-binding domain-containing protein n=1 Tax=Gorillibacterium sp. CAU 1737 TaxID=3140362 RepID=UPI003260E4EF